jgi:acetylornithine deacetylase
MQALDYARELVGIASPSRVSNVAVSDCAERILRSLDFETERVEYDDENGVRKANVIGKKGRGTGGLTFFGHTDTVPADHWAEGDPFKPFVRDGKLYGRGSCDMKGPDACMMAAAARFKLADLQRPVYIVLTADEEIGYGGATSVVARSELFQEMKSGRGIIGEPTMLDVVHGHKGAIGFIATATGRAAHSSTGRGVNANLAIIPLLVELKKIHDELRTDPRWHNAEFDPPYVGFNIGVNDGNTAVNITAPRSVATAYARPMPGTDIDELVRRVRAAADQCGVELKIVGHGRPMYTDPKSEFVREVLAVTGRPTSHTVPYGTDGITFAGHLPLVVCGPGDIAQAHTVDEWIELDQLEKGTELYAKLIRRFCC